MKKRQGMILALLAHPDDETFIFGGTLAHYAKKGRRVKIVSATKGEMGRRMGNPPFITRETMPIVRDQELREACRSLGAEEPIYLGIRDKTVEFEDFDSLVARLCTIIRANKPDVVLTFHPKWGGHPDHCAIGKAAVQAIKASSNPDYINPVVKEEPIAPLTYYYITFGDSMRQPERYGLNSSDIVKIDISDSLPEKLQAFRDHRTQTEFDEWVWQSDPIALSKFGKAEYFIIGDQKPRIRRDDLFLVDQ